MTDKFDDLSAWVRAQFQHLRRSIGQRTRIDRVKVRDYHPAPSDSPSLWRRP